jgi:hypothetical protein
MEQYLIDTNVVSDYFSASFSVNGMDFMNTVIDTVPNISVITQIELLSWNADTPTEQKVKSFADDSIVLNITQDIVIQCVNIRKRKKIKTPDAIIAATALTYGFTIITNNEKDFSNISGLKVTNPHKI